MLGFRFARVSSIQVAHVLSGRVDGVYVQVFHMSKGLVAYFNFLYFAILVLHFTIVLVQFCTVACFRACFRPSIFAVVYPSSCAAMHFSCVLSRDPPLWFLACFVLTAPSYL